jgi:endonuclease/exonuclease/phosphatase family metal-dependent hydrolase
MKRPADKETDYATRERERRLRSVLINPEIRSIEPAPAPDLHGRRNEAELEPPLEKNGSSKWACSDCTLLNDEADSTCLVCEAARLSGVISATSSALSTSRSSSSTSSRSTNLCATSLSSSARSTAPGFTVMSINVWFETVEDRIRMESIADTVRAKIPDFLCLQEITDDLLMLLRPLLTAAGYSTSSSLQSRAYGEMLWWRQSTVCCARAQQRPFESAMGRQLHRIDATVRGRQVAVFTSHLESLAANSTLRKKQLAQALLELSAGGMPAVFAGDTNLGARDANLAIPAGIRDAWEVCGSDPANGPTWDTVTNLNLATTPFTARCRFDRSYFTSAYLRCTHFELVCTDRIMGSRGALHASDHYGLFIEFEFT